MNLHHLLLTVHGTCTFVEKLLSKIWSYNHGKDIVVLLPGSGKTSSMIQGYKPHRK